MLSHRFSINLPDKTFKALKIKSAYEGKTIKDIILYCIKETLGELETSEEELRNNIAFLAVSNQSFSDEWDSKEDEETFKNLQKYLLKQ